MFVSFREGNMSCSSVIFDISVFDPFKAASGFPTWGYHLLKRFWSCWMWPFQQTMCWRTCCGWRGHPDHPAVYPCKSWRRYGIGCVRAPWNWQTSSRWHDGRLAILMTYFLGWSQAFLGTVRTCFHIHRFLVRITRISSGFNMGTLRSIGQAREALHEQRIQRLRMYSYGVADYSMEEAVKKASLSSKSCAAMVHQVMRQTSFTCSPALSEKIRHLTDSIPILGRMLMFACYSKNIVEETMFLQCFFFQFASSSAKNNLVLAYFLYVLINDSSM